MIARILALILAATAIASAQQSQPSKTPEVPKTAERPVTADTGKTNNTSNNQDRSQTPISITVTQPQPDAKQLQRERSDREREIAIQEAIGAYTGGLVWIGVLQLLLILVTVVYTGRAANAAKVSANAAMASADVAERSLVATQRAYVTCAPRAAPVVIDGQRVFNFHMMFSNEGNTPALDAINYFAVVEHTTSLPTLDEVMGPGKHSASTYVGPKREVGSGIVARTAHSIHGPDQLSIEQGMAVRSEKWICLVGWMAYRDAFGHPRVTQFCYQLKGISSTIAGPQTPLATAAQTGQMRFTFDAAGDFNRIDEACQLYDRIVALLPERASSNTQEGQRP